MTEQEWISATGPGPMLEFLRMSGRPSERKVRLFAVACWDRIWDLMSDEQSHEAVNIGERLADGLITEAELENAREGADYACGSAWNVAAASRWSAATWTANAAANAAYGVLYHYQDWVSDPRLFWSHTWAARAMAGPEVEGVLGDAGEPNAMRTESQTQCALLRDIFGNPFRPVAFDPAWRTSPALAVAQSIYDARRFADLPVLADALEEAGCTDASILGHLRGPGPHVRGCWPVDLILGNP